jgi:hypothetical protein
MYSLLSSQPPSVRSRLFPINLNFKNLLCLNFDEIFNEEKEEKEKKEEIEEKK